MATVGTSRRRLARVLLVLPTPARSVPMVKQHTPPHCFLSSVLPSPRGLLSP